MRGTPFPTLDSLLVAMQNRFITIDEREVARDRLVQLKFENNYAKYCSQFRNIQAILGDTLSDIEAADRFFRPLPLEVHLQLRRNN